MADGPSFAITGYWLGPDAKQCYVCMRIVDLKVERMATMGDDDGFIGHVCRDCCAKAIERGKTEVQP